MKRTFLAVALTVIFISCKNSASTDSGTAATTSQQDKDLANNAKVYTAIETGNTAPIDTLIATDAVDHDGPNGTPIHGRDSILHMLANLHNQFKDLKLDIISSAENGDYIFTLVHFTGTPTDSSMGGNKIDENGVDVIKVKDGKMSEHWGFSDNAEVGKRMMEMESKMKGMNKKK
jgi:predicted SnoaL-like aldol condensation-catalyzing enzyme